MKRCPKCGTEFTDADLRSMCGACLVSLQRVDDPAPDTVAPGPMTIAAAAPMPDIAPTIVIPTVTIAMPELPSITVPEAATPVIPPITVPATAGEAADPLPTVAPVVVAMPDLPGTTPPEMPPLHQPPGAPMPAPVTPQPNPAAPPAPIIIPPTPAPEPAPARPAEPKSSAFTRANTTSDARPTAIPGVARALTTDEIGAARSSASRYGIFAVLLGIATFGALMKIAEGPGALLWFLALTGLTVWTIRHAIYRGAVSTVEIHPIGLVRLGTTNTLRVSIATLRDLTITDARLVISNMEIVMKSENKETRHVLFTRDFALAVPGTLRGGMLHHWDVPVSIPPGAAPTFMGRHNRTVWQARVWVGIPGMYADVRHGIQLTVPPLMGAPAPVPVRDVALPPAQLGDLTARLTFTQIATEGDIPVLRAGSKPGYTLTIQSRHTATSMATHEKLWLELAYVAHGAGQSESATIARVPCLLRTEISGEQTFTHHLDLPANLPVSYQGHHFHITWTLVLRREIPWQPQIRQTIPILVRPGFA